MKSLITSGLPRVCWNAIALSGVILSTAIAVKIVKSSNVTVAVANTKLEVSNQIYQASNLLDQTSKQLEQQQRDYLKLKTSYDKLLATTNGSGLKQLKPAIEAVKPKELEAIANDIEQNKQQLEELIIDN